MDYYPQSMGPHSAPFIPYLDQLEVGAERVVYQPHLQAIVAPGYKNKKNTIHPPLITVQCETGMFACNYHEIRKDVVVNEEDELIVPPWLERTPTPAELAVEERFRAQEDHWENKYWEEMEKKMKEAVKAQERGENAGRRPSVTANVLKPGVSAHTSPSHIQKADSFRRVLGKKDGSAKSGAGSSRAGGGGADAHSNYTGSECGTARPHLERKNSIASSVASKSVGGRGVAAAKTAVNNSRTKHLHADDVRSITSSNQRYNNKGNIHDRTETESLCSVISSVYSDDDAVRRSASLRTGGLNNSTTGRVGGATAAGKVSGKTSAAGSRPAGSAGGLTASGANSNYTSRTSKMSPRQRLLQQQQEQLQSSQHHRMGSSVSSSSMVVPYSPSMSASSPLGANGGAGNNTAAPLPTNNTSSMTTPFTSKCFIVAEGTDPFAWGSPTPIVSSWLREVLDGGSPTGAATSGAAATAGAKAGGSPVLEASGKHSGNEGLSSTLGGSPDMRSASPPANNIHGVTPAPSSAPSPAGAHNTTAVASPERGGAASTRAGSAASADGGVTNGSVSKSSDIPTFGGGGAKVQQDLTAANAAGSSVPAASNNDPNHTATTSKPADATNKNNGNTAAGANASTSQPPVVAAKPSKAEQKSCCVIM